MDESRQEIGDSSLLSFPEQVPECDSGRHFSFEQQHLLQQYAPFCDPKLVEIPQNP
jgi:hypothetical protein